jgi:alanyl-tRNA synthetase
MGMVLNLEEESVGAVIFGPDSPDRYIKEGDIVTLKINKNRRLQLTQHHSATHIVNAAARELLGNHVNQAGAKKTLSKAHLDITHLKLLPMIS